MMKLCVSAILALLLVGQYAQGQESHGAEGGGGEKAGSEESIPFCSSSVEVLSEEILRVLEYREYDVYINCLAFGEERQLESGVVSRFPQAGDINRTEARFVLECENNALLIKPSEQPAIRLNLTAEPHHTCVHCTDAANEADVCPVNERCPTICDKCYEFTGGVVTCTDCAEGYYRLLNSYPAAPRLNAEAIEEERELLEERGEEEECEEISPDPELGTSFSCVATCPDNGNYSKINEEKKTCYACGLEYCVTCEPGEGESHGECLECLDHTVLFEGECFSCPLALIAKTAIVQEAEEEEEERANLLNRIELGISLPIVSLLVIAFFLLMSVYAHYRYPHISHRGHKRHRRKPEAYSESSPAPEENGDEDVDPLSQSSVWRARPTIRIR